MTDTPPATALYIALSERGIQLSVRDDTGDDGQLRLTLIVTPKSLLTPEDHVAITAHRQRLLEIACHALLVESEVETRRYHAWYMAAWKHAREEEVHESVGAGHHPGLVAGT